MRYLITLWILHVSFCNCFSQDTSFVREQIIRLTSAEFKGRGYVQNGCGKAAKYLAAEFKKAGCVPVPGTSYFQWFRFPVNTFPSSMEASVDGRALSPGSEFLVAPGSPSVKGRFHLVHLSRETLDDSLKLMAFRKEDFSNAFVFLKEKGLTEKEKKAFSAFYANPFKARGIITEKDKLTWSVSTRQGAFLSMEVANGVIADTSKFLSLHVEAEFERSFKASNVIAMIPGSTDSFFVYTAHYDHLGMMGDKTMFPGANDNASGTSMLLDMARHYSANKPRHSVLFIAFAAEEAGLIGSEYYVRNPVVPLEKMKFLMNLDLLGNGSEGITVVNSEVLPQQFAVLDKLNETGKYLDVIKKRGKAANSDHYWFFEKGVPSFFIYTMGGSKAYHDPFDTHEKLRLDEYIDIFKLLVDFERSL